LTKPVVSIVIPTAGRPKLLTNAVRSAIAGMADAVEVIVIPNGPDGSWRDIQDMFASDPRVRFEPIETPHANAARNHGLALAQGRLIRFLDDDDYLIESGAKAQYSAMQAGEIDICTGAVKFIDKHDREFDHYLPTQETDFVEELFLQRPSTLPVAHVFRREFLGDMRWDVNRPYLQDVDWMYSLARRGEVRWLPLREIVGAWVHHGGTRTSVEYAKANPNDARMMAAEIIRNSITVLDRSDRLSPPRRKAAAKALWDYAPESFVYAPVYWSRIAIQARRLDKTSRPEQFFYHRGLWRRLNPIVLELIFLPLRVIYLWIKSWIGSRTNHTHPARNRSD
jgi:glycosyltransferase involved in cell wall biosynthesis